MNYSVGDKVEVKPKGKVRVLVNGILTEPVWEVWLTEILPMKPSYSNLVWPRENDQVWAAKFTRASHSTLIQESWITRKLSSNFEGFFPKTETATKQT